MALRAVRAFLALLTVLAFFVFSLSGLSGTGVSIDSQAARSSGDMASILASHFFWASSGYEGSPQSREMAA